MGYSYKTIWNSLEFNILKSDLATFTSICILSGHCIKKRGCVMQIIIVKEQKDQLVQPLYGNGNEQKYKN